MTQSITQSVDTPRRLRKERKLHVLYLAPKCFPPTGSEALTNAKLATAVLRAGIDLDVVCATPSARIKTYPESRSEIWAPLARVTHQVPVPVESRMRKLFGYAMILWQTKHVYGNTQWVLPALKEIRLLLGEKKYDCIVSRSGPAELAAMTAARESSIPWIVNWNDPFPWDKGPRPYGHGPDYRLRWYWRRALEAIAQTAAWHTYPCERLREYMIGYLPGSTRERSSVIPHIALDQFVIQPQTGKGNKLALIHAGDLRPPRDSQVFLQGLREFVQGDKVRPEIAITFVGRHPADFTARIADMNLQQYVTVLDELSYEQSLRLVNEADMTILIEAPCEVGIFLPNKVVESVQSGKPVFAISPQTGTLNDLISKHGGGVIADCTKPTTVCEAIARIYASWQRGDLLRDYLPTTLLEQFNEDRVVNAFRQMLNGALGRTQRSLNC